MSGFTGLAGSYTLHPGRAVSITGHRPVLGQGLLTSLVRGQAGEQLERTLAALFTLCSHAHRRAARLALNAACQPDHAQLPEPPALLLILETTRDHLRSMALDWPRQLAQLDLKRPDLAMATSYASNQPLALDSIAPPAIDSEALAWLKTCPLTLTRAAQALTEAQMQDTLLALRTWLQERVLRQPLGDWLSQHRAPEALAHWCHSRAADLPPARFLATCHALASRLSPPTLALALALEVLDRDTLSQSAQLSELAQHVATQNGFAQFPTWRGQCHETGPWTRLRDQPSATATSTWTRLASRWLELIELANVSIRPHPLPEGGGTSHSAHLATGAQHAHNAGFLGSDSNLHAKHPPGTPEGGWTLDSDPNKPDHERVTHLQNQPPALLSSGALNLGHGQAIAWVEMARGLLLHWVQLDADGKVADYRVVAPTEWNFHPEGALARALRVLPAEDTASAWILAAAYDACVECQVATGTQ